VPVFIAMPVIYVAITYWMVGKYVELIIDTFCDSFYYSRKMSF